VIIVRESATKSPYQIDIESRVYFAGGRMFETMGEAFDFKVKKDLETGRDMEIKVKIVGTLPIKINAHFREEIRKAEMRLKRSSKKK